MDTYLVAVVLVYYGTYRTPPIDLKPAVLIAIAKKIVKSIKYLLRKGHSFLIQRRPI